MPPQTFPCPFCGKKMGVGIELLGKKVRCPHCNQILVAPTPTVIPVPPPPVASVVAIPIAVPPPAPIPDLPTFNLPSQEARESIFDEREDETDDVFGSSGGNRTRVPEMPEPPPAPPPPPVAVEPLPAPVMPLPVPAFAPTVESNAFEDLAFAAPPAPVAVQPLPPPVVVPPVAVSVAPIGATPPSSAGGNPWAGMDELPAVSAPLPVAVPTLVPVPVPLPDESPFSEPEMKKRKQDRTEEEDRPSKRTRAAAPTSGGNPLFRIGFFILAPYALIVTVAAIYGLFIKSSVPAGHPLSNLPDNFGEFGPAERKKSGKFNVPLDGELPTDQKVALGGKLEIGQLEIEPRGIEQRPLRLITQGKTTSERSVENPRDPAVVLTLRIKNTSDDLTIHPLDPAFNRRITGSEKIGTNLIVGKAQPFQGGAIQWPFGDRTSRKYEEAQEKDATPLKPGESRDFVVFTDAKQEVVKAVKAAKESLLWRVQVRRGRIDFEGKDIPVTAIIGVEFKASDVKSPD